MNASRWAVLVGLLAAVVVAFTVSTGTSQPTQAAKKTVFSSLKIGQSVTLRDKGAVWEIGTTDEIGPMTHKVLEIETGFIVLHNEAGSVETRIPTTAVRAVVHVRTKPK